VPARRRKRMRLGASTTSARRLRAERPNQVWALDFQFDTTDDGRILKLLHVVDEHTREALAIVVARRIDADRTVAVLERLVAERQALTAHAIRDWCRTSGAGSDYIEPGSPWENPFVESFGGRVRDEVLGVEAFSSLLEAQVLVEDWSIEYNTTRPHSSLGWLAPAAYAESCRGG
jgi:putative transposase